MGSTEPDALTEWEKYLWDHTCSTKRDLRLFPDIFGCPNSDFLLKTRLQWLIDASKIPVEEVFSIWKDPTDEFLKERLDFSGHLTDFHYVSKSLPILLFKEEVKNWEYFRSLYWCLRVLPTRIGLSVFVVGPTAGGEVEVASATGADTYLIGPDKALWLQISEERLFHTGVNFESTTKSARPKRMPLVTILSPWCPDPARAVRAGYESVGGFGFLLFPSRIISMNVEAERLGLVRIFHNLNGLATFYKPIDLPYLIGDEENV